MADVAHQFSPQVGDGGEDAACDDVTFDLGEPQLDLVEPGRVSRREVQVDRRPTRAPEPELSADSSSGGRYIDAMAALQRAIPCL